MYSIKALDFHILNSNANDSLNWIPNSKQIIILENNNYTCQCCGLQSRPHRDYPSGYIEIVTVDKNIYILCSMCAQSQYLGRPVNGKKNHGLIIYCPTLTQGQLIKCAQWSYIAKFRENKYAKNANTFIGMVTKDLISPVEKIIPGFSSGDVSEFSDIYANMSLLVKKKSLDYLKDLRYWPNEVIFKKQLNFWNVASFQDLKD